jgi:hypothetical protein
MPNAESVTPEAIAKWMLCTPLSRIRAAGGGLRGWCVLAHAPAPGQGQTWSA